MIPFNEGRAAQDCWRRPEMAVPLATASPITPIEGTRTGAAESLFCHGRQAESRITLTSTLSLSVRKCQLTMHGCKSAVHAACEILPISERIHFLGAHTR